MPLKVDLRDILCEFRKRNVAKRKLENKLKTYIFFAYYCYYIPSFVLYAVFAVAMEVDKLKTKTKKLSRSRRRRKQNKRKTNPDKERGNRR